MVKTNMNRMLTRSGVLFAAGGTLYVASPGEYRYPRALPWDMSAEDLELALEWTNDVGEVTVLYSESADGTRSFQITFDVSNRLIMAAQFHREVTPSSPSCFDTGKAIGFAR